MIPIKDTFATVKYIFFKGKNGKFNDNFLKFIRKAFLFYVLEKYKTIRRIDIVPFRKC